MVCSLPFPPPLPFIKTKTKLPSLPLPFSCRFGLGTAFLAFYVAFAALISPPGMTYFRIPVWQLGGNKKEKEGH